MSGEWHVPLPTEKESMEMAVDYLQIAIQAAKGNIDQASELVEKFVADDDPQVTSFRLWAFAAVGPVLACAAIQQVMPATQGEQWIVEQARQVGDEDEPAALAAAQAVCFHLNGDEAGSRAVMTAHFDAAKVAFGWIGAHNAMLTMALFQLQMLASMIRRGAFGGAS